MVAPGKAVVLHEFMAGHRAQLLERALESLRPRDPGSTDDQLLDGIPAVFDMMVANLRQNAGVPAVPASPEQVGANVGRSRQQGRSEIGLVVYGIGAISNAVGTVGSELGLSFDAEDYRVFNQMIDASTASAIEEYSTLERAERRLEHARIVGFLAHELRNALSVAQLSYASLKRGELGINGRTGQILGRSLSSMQDLIRQTMAAVQLEAGAPVERRSFDVRTLFRELETTIFPAANIDVQWKIESDLFVVGDQRLLLPAAGNLIQNAIKFSRRGGTVVVRAFRRDAHSVLEVEDQCGGLPPGSEESLFQPFTQKAGDRSGMGLGLPLARQAVEAQGGQLTIQNLPGRGCIARVVLPAASSS